MHVGTSSTSGFGLSSTTVSKHNLVGFSLVVDPLSALSIVPQTPLRPAVRRRVDALAVLFAVKPLTLVLASIRPKNVRSVSARRGHLPMEDSKAFFFIVHVVAFVFAAVGPREHALTLHLVDRPLASVFSAITPVVDT